MRRTKRFASFVLAACMGVSLLVNVPAGTVSAAEPDEVVSAEATETDAEALDEMQEAVYDESEADADGFKWNGTAIVGYVGKGGDVKIPEKCTSIGSSAFKECDNLTSIVIPKGVTSIGSFAFMDCTGMASVGMPASVTSIGHHAFWGCYKLKNIEIPVSVTSIGKYAFYGCSRFADINIPANVTSIGVYAFRGCGGMNGPTSIVVSPENTTYNSNGNCNAIIETKTNKLIQGCMNTKIPMGVTSIGDSAFADCVGLKNIEIPVSVTSIGNKVFMGCYELTGIKIPTSVTSIGDSAFWNCHCIKNVEIPASVKSIGSSPFIGCQELSSIIVSPENATYNSNDNCNAIIETKTNKLIQGCKDTKIPTSVTSIGDSAFAYCSELTSIEIPKSITSIGKAAFDQSGLKTIYGDTGSYAEAYAKENGYTFKAIEEPVADITISYRTHVQKDGWQGFVTNGTMSGTSGQFKRLEGIEIKVEGNKNLGIQYTTHCQTYGWLPWSANGEMSGTQAEAKRLEAIKIQLTGKDKDKYDVYYRVHAQSYGWLGWAKNGACAGTAGQAKRLEGIQIVVIKHGDPAPGLSYTGVNVASNANSGKPYVSSIAGDIVIPGDANGTNIMYKTHVQSFGWQNWVLNGTMSGTSGKAKRLEGINIKLSNAQYAGGIEYRTHIQKNGWEQGWKKDGAMSGTSGEAKRLEAIQIRLYGEMAEKYDVYYRVHAQSFGWLGWAKNGEESGTAGLAKRLEGIQIVLVPKGGTAPAANYGNIQSTNAKAYIKK